MQKIAIISDIHSNIEALNTVMNDIKKRNVDKIICLGDIIAKGINPSECIKVIRQNCDVIIQGNCDRYFSTDHSMEDLSQVVEERIRWNQEMLSTSEVEFLKDLPFSYEMYIGGSLVRFFHATPTSDEKFVSDLDNLENKFSLFCPSDKTMTSEMADIVIYGHLHAPYLEKIYNRTIINVGSVGNPIDIIRNEEKDGKEIETTQATYVIIEGTIDSREYADSLSIQFIKVPYDIEKELNSTVYNMDKKEYEEELRHGKYRDREKLIKRFKDLNIDTDSI